MASAADGERWSRLPTSWIHSQGLAAFRGGRLRGGSIAALKLYVAILLTAENNPAADAGPNQGSVALSYDMLAEMTDLSRAMIAQAGRLLVLRGLVWIEKGGRGSPNRYRLIGYERGDPWGKIANRRWFGSPLKEGIATLHDLSCRRECDLNALKLYLLFCTFAQNFSHVAMIGYEKIEDYTGIATNRIRQGLSVLIEHGLISVDREKSSDEKRNHPNKYKILGL
jgi:hypothetical protein